ncbi:transglutaminase family protein [Microbacterium sp. RD1]|uniref:transglutaminase family protein n=1 Tax=Microbacterium sp. RD1 TaxID=3457313 RepID=UPI003FA5A75F
MSADPWTARRGPERIVGRRRTDLTLAIGVFVAIVAAVLPILRVIEPAGWLPASILLAAAVLGTGFAARWFRLPGVAVALLEAATWVVGLTALFGSGTAFVWIIPSPESLALVPVYVSAGVEEIVLGAAPLEAAVPLAFLLVAAVGLVAIALDHVVLTARMPLLAAVGLIAVSLIPSIAVPGEVDLPAFVLLGSAILFLMRVDTRARQRQSHARVEGTERSRQSGATATAVGIGAIAVIVALVAGPLLPAPGARAGGTGVGVGATIDPTLELGDDLRQPREVEVLSLRSTAANPPYLRAVTLSRFDGAVWEPDDGRTLPLEEGAGFPELAVDGDVEVGEYRTTVEITDLNSPWLPVPYPATSIAGLDGAWGTLAQNRTVVTRTGSTQGQVYEVVTHVPRPTLEQIRARNAGGEVRDVTFALPEGMPDVIGTTAREITASATNDYDALQALQSWFRSSAFSYSLEAPVDDGFDGSGAEAVAQFLEEREGYCVHFASAFALMARSLGMPTRIVVGYLPGANTSTTTQGQTLYTVSSSQLHAWPEVHFEGLGWIPFEPTNSLGVPTTFSAAFVPGAGSPADRAPQQSAPEAAAPTATPPAGLRPDENVDAGGGAGSEASANPAPGVAIGFLTLLLLVTPAVLGEVRRRRLLADARGGDAASAWLTVQEVAIDLGVPVPAAESPRAFGARLASSHGAPAAAVAILVTAIEHSSYAGRLWHPDGAELATAVVDVRAGLRAAAPRWRRALALVAPRSIVIRPGSAYAHPPEPAPAH